MLGTNQCRPAMEAVVVVVAAVVEVAIGVVTIAARRLSEQALVECIKK